MIKVLKYQGPLLAWAFTIFVLSSLPQIAHVPLPYQLDKLAHAIVYGVLAWTAYRAIYHQSWWNVGVRRALILAVVFATVYGLSDEFHQSYVPGRVPSWLDLGADVVGAVVAAGFIAWQRRPASQLSRAD